MPVTLKALRTKDYSENPQTLGEHLKKRRRELGLLQREAAERMGIWTETYAYWENGHSEPVASQFRPVVAFLGFDLWRDKQDESGATIKMRRSGRMTYDCRWRRQLQAD